MIMCPDHPGYNMVLTVFCPSGDILSRITRAEVVIGVKYDTRRIRRHTWEGNTGIQAIEKSLTFQVIKQQSSSNDYKSEQFINKRKFIF